MNDDQCDLRTFGIMLRNVGVVSICHKPGKEGLDEFENPESYKGHFVELCFGSYLLHYINYDDLLINNGIEVAVSEC